MTEPNNELVVGPWELSIQWTGRGGGGAGTHRYYIQRLGISGKSLMVEHSFLPSGMFLEPYVGRVQTPGVQMEGSGSFGWYAGF